MRTLHSISEDIGPLLLILLIFVASFAVSFVVYNINEPQIGPDDDGATPHQLGNYALLDAFFFVLSSAVFSTPTAFTERQHVTILRVFLPV